MREPNANSLYKNNYMKVLLVDDHNLVRDGIGMVLEALEPDMTILNASLGHEAQAILTQHVDIDLVLLDIALPDMNGIECLKHIRKHYSLLPVIMLSANDQKENIKAAIDAGARGFIPKCVGKDVMLSAIGLVMAGGIYIPDNNVSSTGVCGDQGATCNLTPRQQDVLRLLAEGMSNKNIASELGMAEATVRTHITSILRTLGVRNRTEAAIVARGLTVYPNS